MHTTENANQAENQEFKLMQARTKRMPWRAAFNFSLVLSVLGLAALNVMTVANDDIHAKVYGVVKSVVANRAVAAALNAISSRPALANSTYNKRDSEIRTVTAKLNADETRLINANRNLVEKTRILVGAHEKLTEKHSFQTNALRKFSSNVAVRSVKNATRNFSGMVFEAVPYVGVGVIAGVTALDLLDACDNLRDASEINRVAGLPSEDPRKVCGMAVPSKEEISQQAQSMGKNAYQSVVDYMNTLKK